MCSITKKDTLFKVFIYSIYKWLIIFFNNWSLYTIVTCCIFNKSKNLFHTMLMITKFHQTKKFKDTGPTLLYLTLSASYHVICTSRELVFLDTQLYWRWHNVTFVILNHLIFVWKSVPVKPSAVLKIVQYETSFRPFNFIQHSKMFLGKNLYFRYKL